MFSLNSTNSHSEFDDTQVQGFDYPETLVAIMAVALITWFYDFNSLSITLFVVVSIPSLVVMLYNYRREVTFWSSAMMVIILATIVGSMQFCAIISIALLSLAGVRIIKSQPKQRIQLLLTTLMTLPVSFFVSVQLKPDGMECNLQGMLNVSILLISMLAILVQFWQTHSKMTVYSSISYGARDRLTTMVSVINKLTRFIPLQIWQPIVKNNSTVRVANKRAKLTVMFSDIAGFTELSDTLSADNLADILNTYMDRMTIIANRHGAVLDKFIGDGMMCFFGEPTSNGAREDALKCVAMAIDMRREMRTLRHQWRLLGFEGLYVRIGIATGYCHVGNFGSGNRMSYTLIGREANLASRLESAANRGEILISEATYDYICHEYECQPAGSYHLKGFEKPVSAWQVLDPDENKGHLSKWIDHDLPGFNLHLNFKDIKNYDYRSIRQHLNSALERIEREEKEEQERNR